MSKIRDEALARLKNRVTRLGRLIELSAPDAILAREGFMVGEAAQMLSPEGWANIEKERLIRRHKRSMFLCDEDGCENRVAWIPSVSSGAPPGPFHMTSCEKHALETEKEMEEDDEGEDVS